MTGARKDIEAILPATSTQQALLTTRSMGDDVGLQQVQVTLGGDLDPATFEAAWNAVVAHHPALRTTCNLRPDGTPLMVVWRAMTQAITWEDWEDRDVDTARLGHLANERERELDLAARPPYRLLVARSGPREHVLFWTCHHVFLDGWSTGVILGDLVAACAGGFRPRPREALTPYRAQQSLRTAPPDAATMTFWKDALAGISPPPRAMFRDDGSSRGFISERRPLASPAHEALLALAERARVTPGVVAHAAWGLVWGRMLGLEDVVVGTVTAGRSAPIDGILEVAGNLSNALPLRIDLSSGSVDEWLRAVRDALFALLPHEHTRAEDLRDALGWPAHAPVYESLVVVENLPAIAPAGKVTIRSLRSDITSVLPVTLVLLPGDPWTADLRFDQRRLDARAAESCLRAFEAALIGLHADRAPASVRAALQVPAAKRARAQRPPSTPAEIRLAAVWADVLEHTDVGVDDDFFAIGGSSLIAVELLAAIEDRLGVQLPLSSFLAAPTVRTMAALLDPSAPPEWSSLVPLQLRGGERSPLFCLHAGGGHVLYYRMLAARLAATRSVYGLEPVGLDGGEPLRTIEAMAAHYLTEMRTVQPTGPYRLLGYCLGATVGVEICRQLEAVGERVELLVIVDSIPRPREVRRRLEIRLQDARRRRLRGLVAGALIDLQRRWEVRRPPAPTRQLARVQRAGAAALRAYDVPTVQAPAVLIPSRKFDDEPFWRRRTLWWSHHVGTLEVVPPIDTSHETLMEEPGVSAIAAVVDARLDALDEAR